MKIKLPLHTLLYQQLVLEYPDSNLSIVLVRFAEIRFLVSIMVFSVVNRVKDFSNGLFRIGKIMCVYEGLFVPLLSLRGRNALLVDLINVFNVE